jgi:hypothetical protein
VKCVKKGEMVERVKDGMAADRVKAGWVYCPKREWKGKAKIKALTDEVAGKVVDTFMAEAAQTKKDRWRKDKAAKAKQEAKAAVEKK